MSSSNLVISRLVLLSLLGIILFYSFYIPNTAQYAGKKDFIRFYEAATAYWNHQTIYKSMQLNTAADTKLTGSRSNSYHANLATPFFIALFLPFALIKTKSAFIIWSYLNFLLCLISLWKILQAYRLVAIDDWHSEHNLVGHFCLLLGLICYPVYSTILFGQVGTLLLLMVTLAWLAWRRENAKLAGCYLAIASLLKPFFGLFAVLLLLEKNWRGLLSFCVTFILGLFISLLLFGKTIYLTYFHVLQNAHWYTSSLNFSLLGFYGRIFGLPHETNLAYWPISQLSFCLTLLSSLILLAGLYRMERSTANTRIHELTFAYTCVCMLLISPLCWQYYLPILILPLAILFRHLYKAKNVSYLAILSCIAIVLVNIPVENLRPAQLVNDKRIWLDFAYTFYALVLLAWVLFRLGTTVSEVNSSSDQRLRV